MSEHVPMQPVERDGQGVIRFRTNPIVRHLLDAGPFDMNDLARMDFPAWAREQFAQLTGYSIGGYSELPYVSDDSYEQAMERARRVLAEGEGERAP